MFGIGGGELLIILLFAFIIFGPDKLPEIGKTLGKALRRFREVQDEMNGVVEENVYKPIRNAIDSDSTGLASEALKTAQRTTKHNTVAGTIVNGVAKTESDVAAAATTAAAATAAAEGATAAEGAVAEGAASAGAASDAAGPAAASTKDATIADVLRSDPIDVLSGKTPLPNIPTAQQRKETFAERRARLEREANERSAALAEKIEAMGAKVVDKANEGGADTAAPASATTVADSAVNAPATASAPAEEAE